jgi:hypothetical protein
VSTSRDTRNTAHGLARAEQSATSLDERFEAYAHAFILAVLAVGFLAGLGAAMLVQP